ncbi:AAA family ATPase [Croceivirga lutea]|uniref:AAA family ATPase n=1 Tax=Croceivirga lutea TaxID=1775167 RepID=UPI00163B5347|nr:ATP-binding protein [Croceivirga lutea]
MTTKRIVITGAPGTGKTVVVKALEEQGYVCFHEVIRTMTAEAKETGTTKEIKSNPLVFVDDPMAFNTFLLEERLKHHQKAKTITEPVSFFDRGTPDVLAYMNFFNQEYGQTFIDTCKNYRYDQVFILPPWKEIYVRDNERLETFTQAQELHKHLFDTYEEFNYNPLVVPPASITDRVNFVLENLGN